MARAKLSVAAFADTISDPGQRADSRTLLGLMKKITRAEPRESRDQVVSLLRRSGAGVLAPRSGGRPADGPRHRGCVAG